MSEQPHTLLEVDGLGLAYGRFIALKGVSLVVNTGETVAVIGANGAGKSSLIKAICGVERQTGGDIRFAGSRILAWSAPEITRAGIGLVPEGRRIFPSLSVEENIVLGGQVGSKGPWTLERVYALFPDLVEKRRLPGTSLSGGQQQMIAISRALMTNPRLLLCDEISLGLAPLVIKRLYALLSDLARDGLAILVVEQAMRKALEVSDRYYCLLEGRVSLSGRSVDADEAAVSRAYFGR